MARMPGHVASVWSKIGAVALIAAARSAAAAETGGVELSWTRAPEAESCPDAKWMRVAVVKRLGRDPFQAKDTPPTRRIEGTVLRDASTWHGQIRLLGASGRAVGVREFETRGANCDDLATLMALAIGLAIDSEVPESRAAEVADANAVSPPAVPEAPLGADVPPKPPKPSAQSDPTVTFRGEPSTIGIRGGILGGVVARPSAVVMFDGRLRLSELFSLRGGILWVPQRSSADGAYSTGLTAASAGPCLEFRRGLGSGFGACGALTIGSMQTVGNVAPIRSGQKLWAALEVSTFLDIAFARLWVAEASISAYIPFSRSEVSATDGPVPLFQEAFVGAAASVGLARSFF